MSSVVKKTFNQSEKVKVMGGIDYTMQQTYSAALLNTMHGLYKYLSIILQCLVSAECYH